MYLLVLPLLLLGHWDHLWYK